MRFSIVTSFIFCIGNLLSQKMELATICDSSLHKIYSELAENRIYTEAEAKEFGSHRANCDLRNGTKQIMIGFGMFSNTQCRECFYLDRGYKITKVHFSDVIYDQDYSYAFYTAYNNRIKSSLNAIETIELNKIQSYENEEKYSRFILSESIYTGVKLNDTIINLCLYNNKIEELFKSDIVKLTIEIRDERKNQPLLSINYLEMKENGAQITIGNQERMSLYVLFNFEDVPNNSKICWCQSLENEFQFKVPIKLK